MSPMKVAVFLLALGAMMPGQGGAGFIRANHILFPGTGAPAAFRGTGRGRATPPPPQAHPAHERTVIVPYPVYYGGAYYPYDAPPVPDASALPQDSGQYQQSPIVIVNQSYRPDTANPVVHDYSDVDLPQPIPQPQTYLRPRVVNNDAAQDDDAPTIYLIAMKDRSIFATVAYWVDGETVNYVTREGSLNHVSIGLVDREFSKQLNDERHVEFKLPAAK